ncbi:MAG: phosphatidate cytidylyltransferase [Clostridia bacterium]|nr:phosphatidate cytidylyltransferase [Clostridia bacterium]
MKQRIITAAIGVVLLLIVLFSNPAVMNIAVLGVTEMAIFEVLRAVGMSKNYFYCTLAFLLPVGMLFTHIEYMGIVIYIFMALILVSMLFNKNENKFKDAATVFTAAIMICFSFYFISRVRSLPHGIENVFLIFIGCWITDTFAYFTGITVGKHKLAPKISPKKTVEGSIGGIVGTTAVMVAYAAALSNIINGVSANLVHAAVLGFICSIVSQAGDLCASVIKREHNVKDYGSIMPGHGGVMDRFDSLMFVAPIVYGFIQFFPVF